VDFESANGSVGPNTRLDLRCSVGSGAPRTRRRRRPWSALIRGRRGGESSDVMTTRTVNARVVMATRSHVTRRRGRDAGTRSSCSGGGGGTHYSSAAAALAIAAAVSVCMKTLRIDHRSRSWHRRRPVSFSSTTLDRTELDWTAEFDVAVLRLRLRLVVPRC